MATNTHPSVSSVQAPRVLPAKRRNGQLSSCESCRKSKMRCDHARPSCGRCIRRGTSASCFYHPAPMTKLQKTHSTSTASSAQDDRIPSMSPSSQGEVDRGTSLVSMTSIILPLAKSDRAAASLTRTGVSTPLGSFVADPKLIAEGVEILELLCYISTAYKGVIDFWHQHPLDFCCSGPGMWAARNGVETVFRQHLAADHSPNQLHKFSTMLLENTSRPLVLPKRIDNDILSEAFAKDLRWDTVGLYFVLFGIAVYSVESDDPLYTESDNNVLDRKTVAKRVLEASLQCESICDRLSQVNDITIWLYVKATILSTWCYGDDSYRAWRLMGDLASAIFALGHHLGFENDLDSSRYLIELRRRCMALAYETDKALSVFTGRPPRLTRHFCTIELPADVPDDVFLGTVEDLEESISALGADGWNRKGQSNMASRMRACILMCMIQEEVLELSLGSAPQDIEQKAKDLLRRSSETWQSIPDDLHYDKNLARGIPWRKASATVHLQLEHLYTQFLLYKMLVSRTKSYRTPFIEVSHKVLQTILSAAQRRDVARMNRLELEWMAVYHAMPCASVLVLELLHQTHHPEQVLPISRSAIIRDLSVFITCCDWLTEPGEGNHELCKRAQSIFSRGLDEALNYTPANKSLAQPLPLVSPPMKTVEQYESIAKEKQPPRIRDMSPPLLTEDPEFSAWLNDFDLQIDPWLEVMTRPTFDPVGMTPESQTSTT